MSIATEITRLQTAKSNLKTSIENKGVTVPSATKLDGFAALVDQISAGSTPNIQALSVTANGTYTASGGVDGYSPITVNVSGSGGASNYVKGTFTCTSAGVLSVSVPYSGTSYPVAIVIAPTEGPYNSATGSFYTLVARYIIRTYSAIKQQADSSTDKLAFVSVTSKNSTSKGTSTTGNYGINKTVFGTTNDPSTSSYGTNTVTMSDEKTLKVLGQSTANYGFYTNVEYTYHIIYSS